MKKKLSRILNLILLMTISSSLAVCINKEKAESIKYSVTMPQYNAVEETSTIGGYTVDGNYLKYVEERTTVTEFMEKSKLNSSSIKVTDTSNQEKTGEDLIATGSKVQITTNTTNHVYTIVVAGDVNGDGKTDIKDILKINKHRLNKIKLTDEYLIAADTDYNDKADIKDILKINKYRLRKIDTILPIKIEATEISLNTNYININEGQEYELKAEVLPSNAAEKMVQYTSSDLSIATVNEEGKVKGVKEGECTIVVQTSNGIRAECEVKVLKASETDIQAQSIELSEKNIVIESGKTVAIVAQVLPENTSNKTVTWTSSNKKVATVSSQGVITGVGNGTAVITGTTTNGKTATCNITVQTSPTGISLNKKTATLDISGTKTVQLTTTVTPSTANVNNKITWTSSDTKVATVTSEGKVTGVGNGTAEITATTTNGKTATCKVTVQTSPSSIKLNKTSLTLDMLGTKTGALTATISPNTVNINNKITWKSSDTKIVTVTSAGKVTGVAGGEATITATTTNGKTATCKVTVQDPSVEYEAHVSGTGWMTEVKDGAIAGINSDSNQMEAIKIQIENYDNLNVQYRAYIQGTGWGSWVKNGEQAGTTGQSKRMEAIQIKLSGTNASKFDIYYRVHSANYAWLGWAKNGETAGTMQLSNAMKRIQIKIVKKGVTVQSDVLNSYVNPGEVNTIKTLNTSNCSAFTNVANVNSCTNANAICVTDKYYVVTKTISSNNLSTICVFDKKTGNRVNAALKGNFYHANGSTYNSDDKCIYISHMNDNKVSKIKAASLTSTKLTREIITEPAATSGISYDSYTKNWLFKNGADVYTYNKGCTEKVSHFKVVKHTGQDCGVYKGLLLSIDHVANNNNYIYIYDIFTGKCYGKYHVTLPGELESIDYDSTYKRFVMVFNGSDGDKIYTTKAIDLDKYVK